MPAAQSDIPADVATRAAVRNTIVATFADRHALHFARVWVRRLRALSVDGLLVGLIGIPRGTYYFAGASRELRGAVTYSLPFVSRESAAAQGGRWSYVLPLLRTGVRLLVSDVDVAWIVWQPLTSCMMVVGV